MPRTAGPNVGKFFGVGTERIRSETKTEMELIGIDTSRYQAHVLRHTSLSHKAAAGVAVEKFLLDASMSGETWEKYYRVEIEDPMDAAFVPVMGDIAAEDASLEVVD